MASGLLDKANIILTPTGYKAGTMYNVAPIEQPYEDFVFSRASVASRVNSSGLVEMVGRTLGSNLVQNGDFSQIGPDLVQNGTFDLGPELMPSVASIVNLGGGSITQISSNSYSSTSDGTSGSSVRPKFDFNTTSGKTYKLVITPTGTITGTVNFDFYDGSSYLFNNYDFTTTKEICFRDNGIVFGAFDGNQTYSVDSFTISVKEVPDWTLGTGWSVQDNKAYFDNLTGTEITQSLSTTSNSYKINFDLDLQSGSCRVYFNSPGISTQITLTSSGNKTAYITTTTNHTKFTIAGTGGSEFNITNVVVQELDPNDYWNLGAGWSLGDNALVGNGTMTASDTANQAYDFTDGNTYKFTFEITESTQGTVFIREPFNGGAFATGEVGTHTIYGVAGAANELRLRSSDSFIGKITNIVVQEVIDTNNIPRINYDSNGENGHWLLEPTSTNLITYSENFEDSSWSNASVGTAPTLEGGYTAPDGSSNAYKISNANQNSFWYSSSVIGADNSRTIWARTVSGTGTAQLTSHNSNTNNTFNLTETWQRFEVNGTTSGIGSTNFYAVDFRGSGTLTELLIWGAQAEALTYATSYIPTLTGSTETRATETANGAGSADLINSTEGVLYAEIAALADDGTSRTISLSSGSTSNRVFIQFRSTSGQVNSGIVVSNSAQAVISHTITQTQYIKMAFKYKANDFALWVNGVEVGTDTSGTTFTANTLTELNFDSGSGAEDFYGKCKALTVFNTALTDAELTELTS